jgi:ATP adenylyltransferase
MLRSVDAMTWSQLHERMAFMADVIDRAATDPEAALVLDGQASDVQRLFGGEEGLLLSLRHRWMTMLTAKLDQAAHEDIPAEQTRTELTAAHPGLRALLDAAALRSVRVRALEHGEQRIVDLYTDPGADRQTVA